MFKLTHIQGFHKQTKLVMLALLLTFYYHPQKKLWKGNVFTSV